MHLGSPVEPAGTGLPKLKILCLNNYALNKIEASICANLYILKIVCHPDSGVLPDYYPVIAELEKIVQLMIDTAGYLTAEGTRD